MLEAGQSDNRVPNGSTGPQPAKGERALIARIGARLRRTADTRAEVPFGDDMAAIGRGNLLWTTDMLMDGVDFDSHLHSWEEIGRKAMAVNLSDCAAMGVRPVSALCAVALANRLSMDDAEQMLEGAMTMGQRHGCPLIGGDTNSWDHPTVVSITVAGLADPGTHPILRSGAQPGDQIFVTGKLGGSILGRHLRFEPRVELGLRLNREFPVRAMIDISDGLLVDLGHIIDESGCGAEIREDLLQRVIHEDALKLAAKSGHRALEHALSDGEDFELIVVLPRDVAIGGDWAAMLLPVGGMTGGSLIQMKRENGGVIALERRGWEHFHE